MNMTHTQYVLTIAKYGSFSEAAKQLFISQSALSQQIRKLEEELGYSLFQRSSHGVSLTKEGEIFCKNAQPVIEAWEEFYQKTCPKTQTRKLRIGMGSRVYSNGLFEDVMRYFDTQTDLDVTFVMGDGRDFISGLKTGALDLALDKMPIQEEYSEQNDLFFCDLIHEQQCILMSPDDPRCTLPDITFSKLEGCTMITGLENSIEDRDLRELCRIHKLSLKRVYRADSIDTVMKMVRSGKGIVSGPKSFAQYYGVAAVPLSPEVTDSLRFICLEKNIKRRDIQRFCKYMLEICQNRENKIEDK